MAQLTGLQLYTEFVWVQRTAAFCHNAAAANTCAIWWQTPRCSASVGPAIARTPLTRTSAPVRATAQCTHPQINLSIYYSSIHTIFCSQNCSLEQFISASIVHVHESGYTRSSMCAQMWTSAPSGRTTARCTRAARTRAARSAACAPPTACSSTASASASVLTFSPLDFTRLDS